MSMRPLLINRSCFFVASMTNFQPAIQGCIDRASASVLLVTQLRFFPRNPGLNHWENGGGPLVMGAP